MQRQRQVSAIIPNELTCAAPATDNRANQPYRDVCRWAWLLPAKITGAVWGWNSAAFFFPDDVFSELMFQIA
jgi:hypothetical protein